MGSFRLADNISHLHKNFIFAENILETAGRSLCHSCASELTRQGITLPQDRYSYSRRLPEIPFFAKYAPYSLTGTGQASDLIPLFSNLQSPVFLVNSRPPRFSLQYPHQCNSKYIFSTILFIPKLQSHFAQFLQYTYLNAPKYSLTYPPVSVFSTVFYYREKYLPGKLCFLLYP